MNSHMHFTGWALDALRGGPWMKCIELAVASGSVPADNSL